MSTLTREGGFYKPTTRWLECVGVRNMKWRRRRTALKAWASFICSDIDGKGGFVSDSELLVEESVISTDSWTGWW